MIDGLKDKHRNAIIKVLASNDRVERAVLFGSRAMETFTPGSDVDIALFGDELTMTDQGRFAAALEESAIPQRVDLVLYDQIDNDALREHIQRHGIEWYRRPKSKPASRLHLQPRHRRMLEALLRKHLPGVDAWAYGGRVNGCAHDGSDLDLVLRAPGSKKIPGDRLASLRNALRDSNIPFSVEARDWARLPKRFRREIEWEHVVVIAWPVDANTAARSSWRTMPFSEAVAVNPAVSLLRGCTYPYVDMALLSPGTRSVKPVVRREYRGGGSRFEPGDTLMARITPCLENGKISKFAPSAPDQDTAAHGSTEFIVLRGRENVTDTGYVHYLAKSPEVRNFAIGQMTGTSGRQRVPTDCFDHLLVSVPPLAEQRAIAHILGTLDDKIELNRRMNETLEEMARAIYKDWFVDFGPTRAKMEGREPYLPFELWNLLPDAIDDKDKPVGWKCGTVGEYFRLVMGQSPPGSTYNDDGEGLPFFKGCMDFGFRYPLNRRYCTAPTRVAGCDDTLVSVRAPVGNINMAWKKCGAGRGLAVLRHRSEARFFTYYSAWKIQRELKQYEQTGTVFGAINKVQFKALSFLEPTPEMIALFEQFVGPLDERIRKNTSENRTLTQSRDLLLPKLLSGDTILRDTKRLVGEIT